MPETVFKNQEDLNNYDFISHVKISSILPVENTSTDTFIVHKIVFENLELFKGKRSDTIFVYGSNQNLKTGRRTSCDLGENVGEEWIIFASLNKKVGNKFMTGYCTRSKRYKDVNGFRKLGYANKKDLITRLRNVFNMKKQDVIYDGLRIEYFENGNKELEEFYKNNKVDGYRYLWHSDGTLRSKQSYDKGLLNGISLWYGGNGELLRKEKYFKNKPIDTTLIWYKTDTSYIPLAFNVVFEKLTVKEAKERLSRRQIHIRKIYNNKGEILEFVWFKRDGIKYNETLYEPDKNRETVRYYHKNGILSSEMYRLNGVEYGIYREWDENGNLTKSWEFDEKGRAKKETVKKY